MARSQHHALDVVQPIADSGRWPAGSVGTVVEADDRSSLVEISDDRGHALDFVSLPHDALAYIVPMMVVMEDTPGRLLLAMRQRRGTAIVAVLALTVVVLLGYWQHRRETRPSIPKVVVATSGSSLDQPAVAAARRIDDLGFPGFSGWRITGGRTDEVGGRKTATAIYARGRQHISYTLVSGAAHVNHGTTTAAEYHATPAGTVELNWLDGVTPNAEVVPHPAAYVLTFKRDSRTTVLVGTPYRVSVARAMRRLALASF
jgi:hypothetical protein